MTRQERVIAGGPAESMEVRHLVLTGTNEEIGRALADIARERYQAKLAPSSDPLRTRAERRFIEKNYPILSQRMRGVAASFGRRADDDAYDYSWLAVTELRAACSIVHLPPESTAMHTSVVSRDYDYSTGSISFGFLPPGMLHPTARPYLLELHPDRGYASMAMVAYDLLSGVLDGINSEGLTVTMAMDDEIFTTSKIEPTLGPAVGLSELQMLRLLLDTCATAEEAKETLLQTKQFYGFVPVHYLIADRFGKAFVWEYSQAHNKEYIIENPGRPLVMTNFTLSSHLDGGKPPTAEQAKNVCKRYSLLASQLAAGALTEEIINETHRKVDAELPQAADPSRPRIRTFWHALYYPEQRRLKISYYLHDKQDGSGIVRSDYLEFNLAPTNEGKAPASAAVPPQPATSSRAAVDPSIAELEAGGAVVKSDRGRVVAVNLDKADDPLRLLPLLHKLPALGELSAATPKMNDAGMRLLEGLPHLAKLQLYSANVSDDGLAVLKTLPALRFLAVGGTKITDAGLAQIENLTQLDYLGLRGDAITDAALPRIGRLASLNTLNLSETKITDAGLPNLRSLTRLEVLYLAGDDVSDAGLASIESLTTITGLTLSGTKVTDAGLAHLARMNHLTKLNVANTAVTDDGLAAARKLLPFWISIQRQ
jgi:hypothetical protein